MRRVIDVLYNNVGLSDPDDHSALDLSLPVWERVLGANLTTAFLCCKHAIPHMLTSTSLGARRVSVIPVGLMGAVSRRRVRSHSVP